MYISAAAVILGLVANQLTAPTTLTFAELLMSLAFGFVVLGLQRWYRVWKEIYIECCRNLVHLGDWGIADKKFLPYWLWRDADIPDYTRRLVLFGSVDSVLHYLTIGLNFITTIVLAINVGATFGAPVSTLVLIIGILAYLGFIRVLHGTINKESYQVA